MTLPSPPAPSSCDPLTLGEWQARVDAWIQQFKEGYFPPLLNFARLVEETGELSRALSHQLGLKKPKPGEPLGSVEEELADILFVLTCMANQLGLDLTTAAHAVLDKIERRDRTRWTLKTPDPGDTPTSDSPTHPSPPPKP